MATLIAPGGRRSTAPVFAPQAIQGTQALNLGQLLQSLSQPQAATSGPRGGGERGGMDALSGSAGRPGSTAGASFSFGPGGAGGSGSGGGSGTDWQTILGGLQRASGVLGAGGVLAGNAGIVQIARNLAPASQVAGIVGKAFGAKSPTDLASAFLPALLQRAGASLPVAGAVMGGINKGVPGAVGGALTGAISAAVPPLGALNLLSALFKGPTISSIAQDAINYFFPDSEKDKERSENGKENLDFGGGSSDFDGGGFGGNSFGDAGFGLGFGGGSGFSNLGFGGNLDFGSLDFFSGYGSGGSGGGGGTIPYVHFLNN